ncbi:hypothetical protein LSTR_LSTR006618 [Laodelphax striatellus]|uniref:Carboxylesterase type B domain-containing protein n=1 Tax=Laodelphax striatellus TaxID=195883 RepID=A0A482X1L9_LAOST|nr:hypothetical protein LSTR_LSTR006618 [Laodelphax striatellus]
MKISDNPMASRKYPVIVFIHGESFEWNSGNPYDGSVLASFGEVIVITLNFRLGILGFLRPGVSDHTLSNFGLLDQIAALQWIKDNIRAFGGDENKVTLMGHDTGAACVNYLMVSPVSQGVTGLFHRAILMSGTALADWALTKNPMSYTVQVGNSLNCPTQETSEGMSNCLRRKRLSDLMAVKVGVPPFQTPFGPLIDGTVVPNEPAKLMTTYKHLFSRYELLYGMTEIESDHLLDGVSLAQGMLEEEKMKIIKDYIRAKYEALPNVALAKTITQYTNLRLAGANSVAEENRNIVLNVLSDARVAAPLVQTANYHSQANRNSYFYVFRHKTRSNDFRPLEKSGHGEELPYVFGVPLDTSGDSQYQVSYNTPEKVLSEYIMTLWTNFAKSGNPNIPKRVPFIDQRHRDWRQFDLTWPEYTINNQSFLSLGIPPKINQQYRAEYMRFWNDYLPDHLRNLHNLDENEEDLSSSVGEGWPVVRPVEPLPPPVPPPHREHPFRGSGWDPFYNFTQTEYKEPSDERQKTPEIRLQHNMRIHWTISKDATFPKFFQIFPKWMITTQRQTKEGSITSDGKNRGVPPPPPPRVSTLGRRPTNNSPVTALNSSHITVHLTRKEPSISEEKVQGLIPVKSPQVPMEKVAGNQGGKKSRKDQKMSGSKESIDSKTDDRGDQQMRVQQVQVQQKQQSQQQKQSHGKRAEPKVIIKPSTTPIKSSKKGPGSTTSSSSQIPRVTHSPIIPQPPASSSGTKENEQKQKPAMVMPSKSNPNENLGMGRKLKINPVKRTVSTETGNDITSSNTGTIKRMPKK